MKTWQRDRQGGTGAINPAQGNPQCLNNLWNKLAKRHLVETRSPRGKGSAAWALPDQSEIWQASLHGRRIGVRCIV
jgi:hypothetical protein